MSSVTNDDRSRPVRRRVTAATTMTDKLSISRRTVLAGLGTIGIASAGAGLGTTAYFRDEESVAAELDAGRVDLLVDFRATYDTWLNEADTADVVNGPALPDPSADAGLRYVVGQAPDWRADADGTPLTGDEWGDLTTAVDACAFADTTDVRAEVEANADLPRRWTAPRATTTRSTRATSTAPRASCST